MQCDLRFAGEVSSDLSVGACAWLRSLQERIVGAGVDLLCGEGRKK